MLAASHIVAGGVVGSYLGNPFLAFLLGIVIHFILDSIPHFDTIGDGIDDPKELTLILVDFLIGMAIIVWVLKPDISLNSSFVWGSIGGMTPDLFDNVPFWRESFRKTKIGGKVHKFHDKIHSQAFENRPILGMLTQYILIGLFIWLSILKK